MINARSNSLGLASNSIIQLPHTKTDVAFIWIQFYYSGDANLVRAFVPRIALDVHLTLVFVTKSIQKQKGRSSRISVAK